MAPPSRAGTPRETRRRGRAAGLRTRRGRNGSARARHAPAAAYLERRPAGGGGGDAEEGPRESHGLRGEERRVREELEAREAGTEDDVRAADGPEARRDFPPAAAELGVDEHREDAGGAVERDDDDVGTRVREARRAPVWNPNRFKIPSM